MVSVIIPVYNRENTIARAIKSVLNQTHRAIEVIVIDDCSTDASVKVVNSIDDPRLILIKTDKNIGACAARNIGIMHASGDLIAFQDSDDEWYKNKLEVQIKALQNENCDIIASKYLRILGKRKMIVPKKDVLNKDINTTLFLDNFIGTPTILGKKSCLVSTMFDINMPRFQDWDLILRLSQKYKICFIDQPLVNAYVLDNSISINNEHAIKALEIIMEKNKEYLDKNKEAYSMMLKKLGLFSLMIGDFNENYFYRSLKVGGFNGKILLRYLQFTIVSWFST